VTQRIAQVALVVSDYDEAIAYFTGTLGFELLEDTALSATKRWVVVAPSGANGARLLLAKADGERQRSRTGDQTGGRVFLFMETDDLRRDHQLLTARGVRFVEEPRETPYGLVAVFEDLYGNRWDLIEPIPQAGITSTTAL
jgi:catechol 2,3-dioxygenase-like lactoylglutathione lyase family enzyme